VEVINKFEESRCSFWQEIFHGELGYTEKGKYYIGFPEKVRMLKKSTKKQGEHPKALQFY